MNKHLFLAKLRKKLSDLPKDEVMERLNFYSEMIEDKMEEGFSEEEAVASIGAVNEIAAQILSDSSDEDVSERRSDKKRFKPLEIILLVLGSPIWLSLVLSVFAILLSLYAALWCLVLGTWALFVSFAACSLGLTVSGLILIFNGYVWSGIASVGVGIVLVGLSIFAYFASLYATKAVVLLSKKIFQYLRKKFLKKEVVK